MHLAEIMNHALMSDGHQLLHFIVCSKNVPHRNILAYLKALEKVMLSETSWQEMYRNLKKKTETNSKLSRRFTALIWSYFSDTKTYCFCNMIN